MTLLNQAARTYSVASRSTYIVQSVLFSCSWWTSQRRVQRSKRYGHHHQQNLPPGQIVITCMEALSLSILSNPFIMKTKCYRRITPSHHPGNPFKGQLPISFSFPGFTVTTPTDQYIPGMCIDFAIQALTLQGSNGLGWDEMGWDKDGGEWWSSLIKSYYVNDKICVHVKGESIEPTRRRGSIQRDDAHLC